MAALQSISTSSPLGATPPSRISDEQVRLILDVSRMLAVPTELDRLLQQIAEISCRLLSCERASIFLHDRSANQLWTKIALQSSEIRIPADMGIAGYCFCTNQVVVVPDPYNDPRFLREPDLKSGFITRNLLAAPMKGLDGQPIGVIESVNKEHGFEAADEALIQLLADQAGVAVQRHQLQQQAQEAAALRREMDLARKAQEKLIPKSAPPVAGLSAVGWTLPASATGGDCFDLWKLPDGRLGVLLADASGHGLAPAMIVSQTRALIRMLSELETDPYRLLSRVNQRLMDDLEWGQFVTAFVGFLGSDGTLQWCSAGQGPFWVRPTATAELVSLNPSIPPLGVEDWSGSNADPLKLEIGGSLLLVSDGVYETIDPAGERFGLDRLVAAIDMLKDARPSDLIGGLRRAVRDWERGRDAPDDQTIVAVARI